MNTNFKKLTNKGQAVKNIANAIGLSPHSVQAYFYGKENLSKQTIERINNCVDIILEEQERAVKAIERRLKG
jgi:predicted transcriptional regulator